MNSLPDQGPNILIVEDDLDTADLLREVLTDHFQSPHITHCTTLAQARHVDLVPLDIALCDMNLPDGRGLELLGELLHKRRDLPVIMVTTENITDSAIQAINIGAYDYIVKAGDYLFALPLVVEKNLKLWRTKHENEVLQRQLTSTLSELREKNEQLETIAATDPLTGLANRRAFNYALDRSFADSHRHGRDLSLVMIDLDGFKPLNDQLGHPFGDRILERTARVLEANCRRYDVAGRLGGDEFVLLLPRTDILEAGAVAQRVCDEFAVMAGRECEAAGTPLRPALSAGVSSIEAGRPPNAQDLVDQADRTLYAAKHAGKGRVHLYKASYVA